MQREYQLTRDPVFYLTAAFFAFLTTALSAVLGQFRFMPISQTLILMIFMAIAVRRRDLRGALSVVLLWLAISTLVLIVLMWIAPGQVERAFADGFMHRARVSEWYFARSPLPWLTPWKTMDKEMDSLAGLEPSGAIPLSYSMLVRVERCLDPVA